jgi:DNA (cytosine-5)-methyltransferase 1
MKTTFSLFEAFSGYGSQYLACKYSNMPVVSVGISEIDHTAITAYKKLHGNCNNYGDITAIDPYSLPDFDIFTYSFPCQDISSAGNLKGFSKTSSTRSSLLWYCEEIIKVKKPKYLLLENVKNLISNRFITDYNIWISILKDLGYNTTTTLLNAKDFGIAQSRERVFAVSSLDSVIELKPSNIKNKFLLDFLDSDFTKELIVSPERIIIEKNIEELSFVSKTDRIAYLTNNSKKLPQSCRIYSDKGLCPTIDTTNLIKIYDSKNKVFRKLSGNEQLRLMGLKEQDITKLNTFSNAQKAKLAGNSIVVPILQHVLQTMLRQ